MAITRREFVRGGLTFTIGAAASGFLSDLARAQGASSRALVILDLFGGNDSLSMLVPYTDGGYYSRRPTIAVPAGQVLQVGSDRGGKALGLHPRLTGLKTLYDQGRLALIQRAGYENSSRSHFQGNDIWATARPASPSGSGWLGRYLDTLRAPVDPLVAFTTTGDTPRALLAQKVAVPAIPSPAAYSYQSPNTGAEAGYERAAAERLASFLPPDHSHLAFVNATIQSAMATLGRVSSIAQYVPSVAYPNTSLAQAFRTVAGAMVRRVGTQVFWVQTGGFDTHASQGPNEATGTYNGLMTTLSGAVQAFTTDLANQGLLDQTLILQFSEFGRRITENGSRGTDHGAASVMMAIGGRVRGGLFGTAPNLAPDPQNPTLENNTADVRYENDFRSVYARVLDAWLGVDSIGILGGDFRRAGLEFV